MVLVLTVHLTCYMHFSGEFAPFFRYFLALKECSSVQLPYVVGKSKMSVTGSNEKTKF